MDEAEKLKAGVSRFITKDQFIYMINKWVKEVNIKHEIVLAFEVVPILYFNSKFEFA